MANMKKKLVGLLSVLVLSLTNQSKSAVNPDIQWESLKTPHFEVIYDARHYQTARKYALRLELNYKLLGSYFVEAPEKTIVILNDNTDLSNGYATRIPYPHIMAYLALPSSHDSISEYADWPQELTLHEYTHILNFEPAHGFMKFLRYGMGTIITPTMLLPRWWHEGVAVEMETRFSNNGRLRSSYQDATLRALVRESLLNTYSLADINESELESWPRGARPYLFGSLIMSELQKQKGGSINNILLQRYSSRVPYLLSSPVLEESGENFENWFQSALNTVENRAQKQLAILRQTPPTEFKPVDPKSYLESHTPQISPNGRFFTFVAKNRWGKNSIQIFDRHDGNRPFDLKIDTFSEFLSVDNKEANNNNDSPPAGNINRLAWFPDSSSFIFDQIRFIDAYSNFSDLFVYNLNTKKNVRLTFGRRLREPALSLDGKQIAAIQLEQSNSKLALLKADGSDLQIVYSPPAFHKIASPIFLDTNTLAFLERDTAGAVQLKKMNLLNKNLEVLALPSLTQIDSLNQELNGYTFVATESGVRNLYFTQDQFKSYQRLTHVETMAFNGTIDTRTNTIYSTIMTGTGLQVVTSPLPYETLKSPPPINPLFDDRYAPSPSPTFSEQSLEEEFGQTIGEKQKYSALNHLAPTYWLPFAYVTENGYGTQLSTSTFDPLEKHAYSIQAGYDSFTYESSIGLSYLNQTTRWPITVNIAAQNRNQPFLESHYEAKQLNVLASHDLRPFSEYMTIGLGFDANIVTTNSSKERIGPEFFFIYDGSVKSSYSEVPFAGYQISLLSNMYIKTNKFSKLNRHIASGTYFHSKYLPERHIALIHLMAQQMEGEIGLPDYSLSNNYHLSQSFNSMKFVLRGYDPGYFYFKSAYAMSLEYHFPLLGAKGWGTLPLFFKRSHLNLFAEALAVDGIVLDYPTEKYLRTHLDKIYSSWGIEMKSDLSLGYYFPVTFLFGIYQRPDYSGAGKTSAFVGFQI